MVALLARLKRALVVPCAAVPAAVQSRAKSPLALPPWPVGPLLPPLPVVDPPIPLLRSPPDPPLLPASLPPLTQAMPSRDAARDTASIRNDNDVEDGGRIHGFCMTDLVSARAA